MGFSFIGTLIAFLILLPSILFFSLFPPKNMPQTSTNKNQIFTIIERIGQMSCLMILVSSKDFFTNKSLNIYAILMMLCIIIYYLLWIRYVVKGQDYKWLWKSFLLVPIPLAVFPILTFGFASIWINSIWLGMAVIILAIGHLKISWQNYQLFR